MIPVFGDSRHKRAINLGGSTSAASHSSILDSAKVRREQRALEKQRTDAATYIQAYWRGLVERRKAKDAVKSRVLGGDFDAESDEDLLALLRAVAFVGSEDVLVQWAKVIGAVPAKATKPLSNSNPSIKSSYMTLLKQVMLKTLQTAAKSPRSANSSVLLKTLLGVLRTPSFGQDVTRYLLPCGYYNLIAQSIREIPTTASKTSQALPILVTLSTVPFFTSPESFSDFATNVLSIPLLPNRLPLASLTELSSKLPLSSLGSISGPLLLSLRSSSNNIESKIHFLANISTFVSPRFAKLPEPAKRAYLYICALLFNQLLPGSLEPALPPASPNGTTSRGVVDSDHDSDDEDIKVVLVDSFTPVPAPPKLPELDAKTYKRLSVLLAPASLSGLLQSCSNDQTRRSLFSYITSLLSISSTSSKRDGLLTGLLVSSPGLVRELWREYIRGSKLGKESASTAPSTFGLAGGSNEGSVTNPANRTLIVPLVLLCDLYSQSLLTMGDDEFFGSAMGGEEATEHILGASSSDKGKLPSSSGAGGSSVAARNPLTTDDLRTLTKQLVNVVWELYWREDVVSQSQSTSFQRVTKSKDAMDVDGDIFHEDVDVRFSLEDIREKVTKLLVAIWARDSRKRFLPVQHWHVPLSENDVKSFVDAAIIEDETIATAGEDSIVSDTSSAPNVPIASLNNRFRRWAYESELERYEERSRSGRRGRGGTLSKRQLAMISPRLGVLNNVPFVLPFEVRVSIFRHFVAADKIRSGNNRYTHEGRSRMFRADVRRGKIAQDGFDKLGDADLKAPIEITFIDQWGNVEAGIDGGGVFKEFFTELCKEVFDTDRGLWLANKKNELYPNPISFATERHSLNWYRFIGRILGKAMYEGILVDVAFAGFFLAKWLGKQSFLDDLASLDPELYNGLIFLKHYTGDLDDLSLNFTVAVEDLGVTKSIDLIPNGSNIAVTKENRLQYIHLVSHYRLTKQIKKQSDAFFEGLKDVIDPRWLRMFNQQEVQVLIGGVNSPVDVDDLRNHTNYGGLYDDKHETIIAFWNVVDSLDHDQRRALLRFVTSCSRPPLLGFKELNPLFAIRDAGGDEDRLPTSSTCVNLLKLPRYSSERLLRAKLLQAINAGAGFDLS